MWCGHAPHHWLKALPSLTIMLWDREMTEERNPILLKLRKTQANEQQQQKTSYWIMGRIVLIEDCCNAVFKHIHGHENTWSCCPWNERIYIFRMNIRQTSQLRNQHFAWELSPSKSEQHHVESCSPFDPMQNSAPCALHGQKVASRERLQAAYTVLTLIPALLWDWSIHLGERDLLSSGYASAISLKG